ncbi:MAG: ATP-binding protein [Treponema sp.]|uniref:ATP-binding protein n=1 Tax=Treponema sp. TaxID=166 RepID=UPI0025CEB382|nr:ATP-binding protein [Treponema sp.]MBR0496847.1 ATP-binding protein [Treponema sp.]
MQAFYDRKNEIEVLSQIERQSEYNACFTVLSGRRRIGKTELLKRFISGKKSAYLFTSRTSEKSLCTQWQKILEENIGLKIFGNIENLSDLFEQIMIFSQTVHFTLIIDEFQDIEYVNKAFFSQMQNIWDSQKSSSKINLIVCGSIYSLMTKIFQNEKEPLFGRATHSIHLKPFTPSVVKTILRDFNPDYTQEDLLCLYMLSGGVAKYIFLLMYAGATTKEKMIDSVCNMASPFLSDGRDILISEIGKDYGTYFSILQAIATGHTSQSEIDSIIQKNTGAYLQNLQKIFGVIEQIRPLLSKAESRNARWQICDEYMRFYFRFIFTHQYLVELGNYDILKQFILRDYETFTGKTLEHYFTAKILEEGGLTKIGGWWDKKSQNEIDIIAVNDLEKSCKIYEIKRQSKKIDLEQVRTKAEVFMQNLPNYKHEIAGLSMEEM